MAPRKSDSRTRHRVPPLAVALGAFLLLAACEDTKIIEVERPFFPQPIEAAGGMLGYDEIDAKLTVCGNCHVGQQGEWEETAHADAWASLQASGHASESCENCHTISENGNVATGEVGYASTQDERFHDVQCESCHGPGGPHVSNPDATQPLASLSVDFGAQAGATFGRSMFTAQANDFGCADCHEGTHHPFVEEWAQSPHAGVVQSAAGNASCQRCHRGQGTLLAWGENADYLEKNSSEHLPVVCAVCHDPHDGSNDGQLRFPVTTTDLESNLCAQCHNRRTIPDPNSSHGLEPHSPEAALLVGDAGYFFPGTQINAGQIRGTHGSERNTRSCATCHVQMEEITDRATGAFVFNSVGHLFRPIPCVDGQGIPQPFSVQCPLTTEARSFSGCTGGACHGSEQAAASALTAASTRIQRFVDELHDLLEEVDPNLAAPGGPIDPANPTFTVAEGAFFNLELAIFGNADNNTNTVLGSATHNPFLMESLLIISIQQVEEEYGVNASIAIDYDAELSRLKAQSVY